MVSLVSHRAFFVSVDNFSEAGAISYSSSRVYFDVFVISPQQNKKALSPFYNKKYFGVLHSFSTKNIFYDEIDFFLF